MAQWPEITIMFPPRADGWQHGMAHTDVERDGSYQGFSFNFAVPPGQPDDPQDPGTMCLIEAAKDMLRRNVLANCPWLRKEKQLDTIERKEFEELCVRIGVLEKAVADHAGIDVRACVRALKEIDLVLELRQLDGLDATWIAASRDRLKISLAELRGRFPLVASIEEKFIEQEVKNGAPWWKEPPASPDDSRAKARAAHAYDALAGLNEWRAAQDSSVQQQSQPVWNPTVPVGLPRWRCYKEVWAAKIEYLEATGPADGHRTCLVLRSPADQATGNLTMFRLLVSDAYMEKHKPQRGGYFVVYKDGYQSYSPAEAFEEGYTLIQEAQR